MVSASALVYKEVNLPVRIHWYSSAVLGSARYPMVSTKSSRVDRTRRGRVSFCSESGAGGGEDTGVEGEVGVAGGTSDWGIFDKDRVQCVEGETRYIPHCSPCRQDEQAALHQRIIQYPEKKGTTAHVTGRELKAEKEETGERAASGVENARRMATHDDFVEFEETGLANQAIIRTKKRDTYIQIACPRHDTLKTMPSTPATDDEQTLAVSVGNMSRKSSEPGRTVTAAVAHRDEGGWCPVHEIC
jgi:hypothetical protein